MAPYLIPGRSRIIYVVGGYILAFMTGCASAPVAADRHIPDESVLRARVDELYRAHQAKDDAAERALVLPQMIQCGMVYAEHEELPDLSHVLPTVEIVAWKVTKIEFDMHYFGELNELCPGQPVRAVAGAMVTVEQTDREGNEEAKTGELFQPWLYVNGTWYWLVDVD